MPAVKLSAELAASPVVGAKDGLVAAVEAVGACISPAKGNDLVVGTPPSKGGIVCPTPAGAVTGNGCGNPLHRTRTGTVLVHPSPRKEIERHRYYGVDG